MVSHTAPTSPSYGTQPIILAKDTRLTISRTALKAQASLEAHTPLEDQIAWTDQMLQKLKLL